ncbi:MAG: A24 family peptidase [Acidibacillus sp.]|nr:A24 family peptidase [Acidibacillus sp.]
MERTFVLSTVIIPIITVLLFLCTWWKFGETEEYFIALFAGSVFIVLSVIDYRSYQLPNVILLPSIALLLLGRIFIHPFGQWTYAIGGLLGFLIIFFIVVLSHGGMGFGDAKLFLFVGLYGGIAQTILTLIISSLLGAVIGIGLIVKGRIHKNGMIAFGPYIGFSAVCIHLYGSPIIHWYLSFFY